VHGFRGEKISLRASALTYITILSLVPFLTVIFAIVRAMGQDELRHGVHDFVFNNLGPGLREQIGGYLDEFIARASSGAMGSLGGVLLLGSAAGLFHNIERSLDEIWGVTRPRPIIRRVVIYWCVLTLGPLALGGSVIASSLARSAVQDSLPAGILELTPWATTVLMFAFLYFAVPNAKVSPRAALAGALVSGTAWEIAKYLYSAFATHSFRYNAIYGSLGAIPLFLIWVYVSWMVVLFGARLAYALQYAITTANAPRVDDSRCREILCARVALEAVVAFQCGRPPPTPGTLAKDLGLEVSFVSEAVAALRHAGLMAEAHSGGIVPGKPPAQICLLDVAQAAGGTLFDHSMEPPSKEAATRALTELFCDSDRQGREALSRIDLGTLARPLVEERPEAAKEKTANPAR
jgi:membrane protein